MSPRNSSPPPRQSRAFSSLAEIDRAIIKLQRRLDELERLDVPTAIEESTGEDEIVEHNIRDAILEVFGEHSPEFRQHQYIEIWGGPERVNMSRMAVIRAKELGQQQVAGVLRSLISRLAEKREDLLLEPAIPGSVDSRQAKSRRVFIGHGRSTEWLKLRDLLVDQFKLQHDEFNRESAAGYATKERLEEMLEATGFAFLVMTAEDEHPDGSHHARENVIHEIGLFQGRHGFRRAIVLLEEGCEAFSNISGLGQIQFPRGDVMAKSGEIRKVLEREGFLRSGAE
jgi:predicted nucleotide-binding protein